MKSGTFWSGFHCPRVRWYYFLIILFLFLQTVIFLLLGENIYVSMHDNLDLHVADYHILKETGTFFAKDAQLPLLNGINRDYFASEFSLYSLLYVIFPTSTAYVAGYLLKTVIALISTRLLAKDILKEEFKKYEPLVALCGFAYGILPLYPTFCFPFVSLPFVILLLRKIYRKPGVLQYGLLFLYPLLSYFTFFGIFILGYLVLAILILWIKDKKLPRSLLLAFPVLFAGYVLFEYRLFRVMLFDPLPTIRDTMVQGSQGLVGIVLQIWETFTVGVFHADAVHTLFLLPLCVMYLFWLYYHYLKKGKPKAFYRDGFVLTMGLILLNCLVYGLYYLEPFRTFVETLIPPLKGFQFSRTVFFNPFLWYAALFFILKRLYDYNKKAAAHVLAFAAIFVILLTGSKYNDLYQTAYHYAYRIIKQKPSNGLTYAEFYSEPLFEQIKKDIGYDGEKSAAYGMHPAVLSYSGITTLDGCLSYYPQSYKEEFRTIIAPALDLVESFRLYYDEWGARAYLFAGVEETIYEPVRNLVVSDSNLYIDGDAFRKMGGRYIFSRIEISNAKELGLSLKGVYEDEASPYTIYLYDAAATETKTAQP